MSVTDANRHRPDGDISDRPAFEPVRQPAAPSRLDQQPSSRWRRARLRATERRHRRLGRRGWAGRHPIVAATLVLLVGISPAAYSLARALADPSLGVTAAARGAEWTRDHGGGWLVVWAENQWFGLNAPPVGGAPAVDAIPAPAAPTLPPASPSAPRALAARAAPVVPAHLPPPTPIQPFASPPIDGEGQWHPVGRPVGGVPAVHEAFLRPDPVHTSLVVGVARMDLKLLSVRLYSGSTIPGAGPWQDTAPITPSAASSLVGAFTVAFGCQTPPAATSAKAALSYRCATGPPRW